MRTQLPVPTDLTAKMAGFAEQYVILGGRNGTLAAKRAGYSNTSAEAVASRLLRDPRILREIRRITETALQAGVVASAKTLEMIRDDPAAPIAERRKAASELLDRGGMILARVIELNVRVEADHKQQIANIIAMCDEFGVDPRKFLGGAVDFFDKKQLPAPSPAVRDAEFEEVAAPTLDGLADLV